MTDVEMSETTFVTRSVSASTIGRVGTIEVSMDTTSDARLCARLLFVITDVFAPAVDGLVSCA